jgi:SAM-dependent methyltransferase
VLADRLGVAAVSACDPSRPFLDVCRARVPGVDARPGRAEELPYGDDEFDAALAQLVLHFVSDAPSAAGEMRRVVRPGGTVAACVWDFAGEMEMLRTFWNAAQALDPYAPDEGRVMRFGKPGEIIELFAAAGLVDLVESNLGVSALYSGFEDLWSGFMEGIGPAGSYAVGLPDDHRGRLRAEVERRLDVGNGSFELVAVARCAVGRVPC